MSFQIDYYHASYNHIDSMSFQANHFAATYSLSFQTNYVDYMPSSPTKDNYMSTSPTIPNYQQANYMSSSPTKDNYQMPFPTHYAICYRYHTKIFR